MQSLAGIFAQCIADTLGKLISCILQLGIYLTRSALMDLILRPYLLILLNLASFLFNLMKSLYFILSQVGAFAVAAFLISFALVLAGALAELVYKLGLPNNNSF
jgi:hypothetical protein